MATQIGFFLKTFYKKFVGSSIQFPVDVFCRFAIVVQSVFGEFDREAMKRAFVEARNEAFDHLSGEKVERFVFLNFLKRHLICKG